MLHGLRRWPAMAGLVSCLVLGGRLDFLSGMRALLRFAIAAVLVAAALLKLVGLRQDWIVRGYEWQQLPTLLLVQGEIVLAVLLLAYPLRRSIWLAAVVSFLAFTVVSGWKVIEGADSCGCFGPIKISPRWVFVFDMTMLIVLMTTLKPANAPDCRFVGWRPSIGRGVILASVSAIAFTTVFLLAAPAAVRLNAGVVRIGEGVELWEPEKWVGQRLPILDRLRADPNLNNGSWMLVLVRRNCSHCRSLLGHISGERSRQHLTSQGARVAILDLEWDSSSRDSRIVDKSGVGSAAEVDASQSVIAISSLNNSRATLPSILCEVPCVLHLVDGFVTKIADAREWSAKSTVGVALDNPHYKSVPRLDSRAASHGFGRHCVNKKEMTTCFEL